MDNEYYEDSVNNSSQQQPVTPYIGSYSQSSDLIRLALRSDDLIMELKLNLMGLEYDSEKDEFVNSKTSTPLINKQGANKVVSIVSSIVNRNTNLSNIQEDEINAIAREVELNINENFLYNWDVYWDTELEASSNWKIVRSMAGNYAKLSLLRAKDGGEINILGGNTKTLIQKSEMESAQRIQQSDSTRGFKLFR